MASLAPIALRLLASRPLWHAYVQFAGDLLLVSGLVYFFGGITSPFSMLYLVVIMVSAVILRRRATDHRRPRQDPLRDAAPAALARNWIPALSPLPTDLELSFRISYNLAVHLFGFYAVALLTSSTSARRAPRRLPPRDRQPRTSRSSRRDSVGREGAIGTGPE